MLNKGLLVSKFAGIKNNSSRRNLDQRLVAYH
jgi:hypothetical protein